jgi:hypothetical protein
MDGGQGSVTFSFTLDPSMENQTLSYTITNQPIPNGVQIPQVSKQLSLGCDSPPDPVLCLADDLSDAAVGIKYLAIGLPSLTRDADISTVRLAWSGNASGSVDLPIADASLTTTIKNSAGLDVLPDSLASSAKRYYQLSLAQSNGCTFSVSLIDRAGQESTVTQVETSAIYYSLSYDGNQADSGAAPQACTLYPYGTNATVGGSAANPPYAKAGYTLNGWNTAANAGGTSYAFGSSISMTQGCKILFAQWLQNGGLTVSVSAASYQSLSFSPSSLSLVLGDSVNLSPSGTLAANGSNWQWYVNGVLSSSASIYAFTPSAAGQYSIYVTCAYGGLAYSGSISVSVGSAASIALSAIPRNGGVSLSWAPIPWANSYKVYYSTYNDMSGPTDISVANNSNHYSISSLTAGIMYYFQLRALNANGIESASSAIVSAQVGNNDLVVECSMSGDTTDTSGNTTTHNGTIIAGVSLTADRFGNTGKAYHFDGTSGYVALANTASLDLSSAATFSLWFKLSQLPNTGGIFSLISKPEYGNDLDLQIEADRKIYFYVGTSVYITSTTVVQLNTWYHVVACYQSGTVQDIWVNGSREYHSANAPVRTTDIGHEIWIGASSYWNSTTNSSYNNRFFPGDIDDVRVYDRAISDAEALSLYNEYDN